MTLGADPISLAIGMESARRQPDRFLQVFTVRKEAKQYGAGRRIEGNFSSGDPIVVVDDVITTGGSTLRAIEAIESEGGAILFAFVLVDREEGGRERRMSAPRLPSSLKTKRGSSICIDSTVTGRLS